MAVAVAYKETNAAAGTRTYAVICDWGERAAVAVLRLPHPPAPGVRFVAFGEVWEVTAAATPTRGPVARPLASFGEETPPGEVG